MLHHLPPQGLRKARMEAASTLSSPSRSPRSAEREGARACVSPKRLLLGFTVDLSQLLRSLLLLRSMPRPPLLTLFPRMALPEPPPRCVVQAKAFFEGKAITINKNTPDYQNLLLGQFQEEASLCKACDAARTLLPPRVLVNCMLSSSGVSLLACVVTHTRTHPPHTHACTLT
jgi:hypothetical protein